MKLLPLSTLGLIAISSANTLADAHQPAETTLVTATRTEQSIANTLESVTVFDRQAIETLQVQSLPELLSRAAGVSVTRNGGRGAVSGIAVRGNQNDHTLILVNGIRIGSATLGSTPLELIEPEQIERIEIVRGPKSSLYGSDALGGVVNIITRKADNTTPVKLKASIGNYNTRESSLSAGYQSTMFSASLTAATSDTDGFDNTASTLSPHDDDDGFQQDTLGLDLSVSPTKALSFGLNYQYSEGENEYDTSCTDSTTYASVACSPYSETRIELLQLSGQWTINQYWDSSLAVSESENESEEFAEEIDITTTFSGGIFTTEQREARWQNDFQINKQLLLTVGYDYLAQEVSGSTDYDVDERDNDAVYAQLQWEIADFSGNLGARNDDNEQFGSYDTYNFTLGYALSEGLKVIASYGEAFKAPTFNDLYYPDFGDPTLVPEESDSYELGLQSIQQNYHWSVRGYRNEIDNLIQYNANIFANDQIASATINGLELVSGVEISGWTLLASVTLLDTENNTNGNELARRPEQTFNLDIDRRFDKWSVGTTLYASSSRYNDADNTDELSGYGTVAIRGAYNPSHDWTLQLKVDNLFEKEYFTAAGSLGNYNQPGLEVLFSVIYTPSF